MVQGLFALAATLILAFATSCGTSKGSPDLPFSPDDPGTDPSAADPGPDTPREPTVVSEAFRIVFPYQQYLPSQNVDVVWSDPANPELSPSTSFDALLKAQDEALSCALGCVPAPSGRWLAVVVSGPTSSSSDSVVRLYRLFDGPAVAPSGIPDIVDVRTFAFGADSFVFSRAQYGCYASDPKKRACVKFFRVDLAVPTPAGEESLFAFPTEDDVEHVLPPTGAFRMGEDGRTIIVLGTTLGSQGVWLWRGPSGPPRQVAGPICAGIAPGGGCLESDSPFSDSDPVALSLDGNHLVLALVENDRSLILTHFDLRGAGTRTSASLLSMPDSISFATNRCYNRQAWQPTFVQPPLRFSPDGTELVFVGGTDCQPNRDRSWTNLLALSLSRIDAEGPLEREDLRWITDFPQGAQLAASVSIQPGSLDLSPSGEYVVFAASPYLDSSGLVLRDGDYQLFNDSEVWVTRRDGTTLPVQMTARQGWKATSARAITVPPPAP